ncbi:MAG: hypothetical protein Q8R32_00760 [bacterium]|nr:hypothetical protein [bacterium]
MRSALFLMAILVVAESPAQAAPATTGQLARAAVDMNRQKAELEKLRARVAVEIGRLAKRDAELGRDVKRCTSCTATKRARVAVQKRIAAKQAEVKNYDREIEALDQRLANVEKRVGALEGADEAIEGEIEELWGALGRDTARVNQLFHSGPYFSILAGGWYHGPRGLAGVGFGHSMPVNEYRWRADTELLLGLVGGDNAFGVTFTERVRPNSRFWLGVNGRVTVEATRNLAYVKSWSLGIGPSLGFALGHAVFTVDGYVGLDRDANDLSGDAGIALQAAYRF